MYIYFIFQWNTDNFLEWPVKVLPFDKHMAVIISGLKHLSRWGTVMGQCVDCPFSLHAVFISPSGHKWEQQHERYIGAGITLLHVLTCHRVSHFFYTKVGLLKITRNNNYHYICYITRLRETKAIVLIAVVWSLKRRRKMSVSFHRPK